MSVLSQLSRAGKKLVVKIKSCFRRVARRTAPAPGETAQEPVMTPDSVVAMAVRLIEQRYALSASSDLTEPLFHVPPVEPTPRKGPIDLFLESIRRRPSEVEPATETGAVSATASDVIVNSCSTLGLDELFKEPDFVTQVPAEQAETVDPVPNRDSDVVPIVIEIATPDACLAASTPKTLTAHVTPSNEACAALCKIPHGPNTLPVLLAAAWQQRVVRLMLTPGPLAWEVPSEVHPGVRAVFLADQKRTPKIFDAAAYRPAAHLPNALESDAKDGLAAALKRCRLFVTMRAAAEQHTIVILPRIRIH